MAPRSSSLHRRERGISAHRAKLGFRRFDRAASEFAARSAAQMGELHQLPGHRFRERWPRSRRSRTGARFSPRSAVIVALGQPGHTSPRTLTIATPSVSNCQRCIQKWGVQGPTNSGWAICDTREDWSGRGGGAVSYLLSTYSAPGTRLALRAR